MSEYLLRIQRQNSQTFSGISNLSVLPSGSVGLSRSRRSSWSDAKV